MPFSVVPVLDLKEGRVVHAVAGRRDEYQRIQSVLQATSEPIPIARAFRDRLGLQTLYLADLDAIDGAPPSLDVYRHLIEMGVHIWVDAGMRDVRSTDPLLELDDSSYSIVVGLETIRGPLDLGNILDRAGSERVIFSLDLFDGRPRVAEPRGWVSDDPRELAERAIERGVSRLLILDLSRVGTGRGPGTDNLLTQLRADHEDLEIIIGGGISHIEDVIRLKNAGAAGVLIGSALNDGTIGPRELALIEPGDTGQ